MNSNFESALAHVLQSEGGYVFNKNDPGGMTNLGCTKAVWEEFVGHPVSEADMRGLTLLTLHPCTSVNIGTKCPVMICLLALITPSLMLLSIVALEGLQSGCKRP